MYLQKLEIQGFKSFAQKTTLEFNQKLTAIVGPNGSGKSNVADAIRWVMGEQSVKLLRGKRAEDVIFAGSDSQTRSGLAEVSIYLNNEDNSAPIDYSEIVVTRRLYRDGQSEYLLNRQSVRLIDIHLLLARANFGQKTYSVIGQGMIDSILLSSPADRKEFFEEATGIKQYQIKRTQAISKLLATYDNLEQAELVLNEITPRLKTLTRQVKRLAKREELERSLTELQKDYFSWRWWHLKEQSQATATAQDQITKEVTAVRAAQQKLESQMKSLQQTGSLPVAYQELRNRHAQARAELTKLLKARALAAAQDELRHIQKGEGEIAWLTRHLDEVTSELNQLQTQSTNIKTADQQLQQKLKIKLSEQSRIAHDLAKQTNRQDLPNLLKEKLSHLSQQYDAWLGSLAKVTTLQELADLLPQAQTIGLELQTLMGELNRGWPSGSWPELLAPRDLVVGEIAELKTKITVYRAEEQSLEARVAKLTNESNTINQALTGKGKLATANQLSQQLTKSEREIADLDQQLADFHQTAESAKQKFFSVQNELQTTSQRLHRWETEQHELALTMAKIDTKNEDLDREMSQAISPELARAVKEVTKVAPIDESTVAVEIQKLKRQLEVTGGIEPEVIAEYQQTKERHGFLSTQEADLKQAIMTLEKIIQDLDQTISKQFLANFKVINEKFSKYFQILFSGGKAQLNLQKIATRKSDEEMDELETAAEEINREQRPPASPVAKEKLLLQEKLKASLFAGVEMQATPPGKKLSSINALSGGEKALTSIALICAIISHLPSPFVVLDEVDAALDEANSERFAAILDNLSEATQFITITHNRATMKRTAILYGVTMGDDGVSRLLSVKLEEAKELTKK